MKKKIIKKIFVCATEQSGDNIGSIFIKELIKKNKFLKIDGVGGSKMKPYMRNQIYSIENFKSLGIVEVIFSINKYLLMINKLSKFVYKNNYDLIITIDSPDFNYPLVKKIKVNGYKKKIIQIVAPTVWAWRTYRAKKFAKIFDEILTLFPFENKYFSNYNIKTTCVGHPVYYLKNNQYVHKNKNLIAFLPGSRIGEIKSLLKYFDLAYEQLLEKNLNYQIFIPTIPHLKNYLFHHTKNWKIKTIITTDKKNINKYFKKTKFALVCSGTASLEVAKMGIPQLVIYKLNIITELIIKFIVKVKFANIINIVENKVIIPELINSKLTKNNFILNFNNLILKDNLNRKQIQNVKKFFNKIELNKAPHILINNRIKKNL